MEDSKSHIQCCDCRYSEDHGDSVEYIYCALKKKRKDVKKTDTCDKAENYNTHERR